MHRMETEWGELFLSLPPPQAQEPEPTQGNCSAVDLEQSGGKEFLYSLA